MGVVQSAGNAYSGTTIVTTLTATPVVGNTLVAIANSDSTLTIDGTWNLRRSFVADQGFYIWDRVAGASEPASVTVTPDGGADHAALVVVELDAGSELDAAGTVSSVAATDAVTAAGTTTSTDDGEALVIAALHGGWTTNPPVDPVYDNGFSALQNAFPLVVANSFFVAALFVGYKELGPAGPVGDSLISWTGGVTHAAGVQVAYKAGSSVSGTLPINFVLTGASSKVVAVTGDLDLNMSLVGEHDSDESHTTNGALGVGLGISVASSKIVATTGRLLTVLELSADSVKVAEVTGTLRFDVNLSGRDPEAKRDITITVGPPLGNWAAAQAGGQWAAGSPTSPGWSMTAAGGDWAVSPPTA